MMAQGTPALGTSSRIRAPGGKGGRGRVIAALAAGAFVLGILLTFLFSSVSGPRKPEPPKASSTPTSAEFTPPALERPAAIAVPEPSPQPAPTGTASASASAANGQPGGAVTGGRKPGAAPTSTAAPAGRNTIEFDPGGI
jgi:hypothetical protein